MGVKADFDRGRSAKTSWFWTSNFLILHTGNHETIGLKFDSFGFKRLTAFL